MYKVCRSTSGGASCRRCSWKSIHIIVVQVGSYLLQALPILSSYNTDNNMHPIIQYRIILQWYISLQSRQAYLPFQVKVSMRDITVKLISALWGLDKPRVKSKIPQSIQDKKIGLSLLELNRDYCVRPWAHDTIHTHVPGTALELLSPVRYEKVATGRTISSMSL